jgi:pilus assembly protein CpaB
MVSLHRWPFRRRLPRSAVAWFGGAAIAAVAAVLATRAHVARLEATRPDVGPPVAVVVAAHDLQRGSTLSASSLTVANVPATLVPPGAVASVEEASGRILAGDLAEGEALTETRLAGSGLGPIAALVPPGLRAFVLPTGPPAGTVSSGDEVDVLATYGVNAGRPYTETVATSLEVVDVVRSAAPIAGADGAVSGPPLVVLADPYTVERLARAASLARLSIAIAGEEPDPTYDDFAEGGAPAVEVQPTDGPSP